MSNLFNPKKSAVWKKNQPTVSKWVKKANDSSDSEEETK